MARSVALLRGINVGGRTTVPMADLRALAEELGWSNVETYIQSGNLLFDTNAASSAAEAALEKAIEDRFGHAVPVIVRSAAQWKKHLAANPFPEAAANEPGKLMMLLSKEDLPSGADEAIQARARDGEKVASAGNALWIHYPAGAGRSRLSPTLIDRLIGSPATARNFRTLLAIGERLGC